MERTSINLAEMPGSTLGRMRVIPAACEVQLDGVLESVEPRVMKVLIVLTEQVGNVVSRDTLVDRCWNGRAISEDALNRVIAKLRQLSARSSSPVFHIDTVKKIGYRLRVDGLTPHGDLKSQREPELPGQWPHKSIAVATIAVFAVVAATALMAQLGAHRPPTMLPAATVAAASDLETRGLSLMFEGDPNQLAAGLGYLKQASEIAPSNAGTAGSLAMAYVVSLAYASPDARESIAARAREAANRAQSIDRHEGRSIAALIALQPTYRNWKNKERLLLQGLSLAPPTTAPLMFQHVQFLASVGRTREALNEIERLSKISPLVPWIQSSRANLLAASGRPDEAQKVAERSSQIWPRERLTWFTRFNLALYGGRFRDAFAISQDRTNWPRQTEAWEMDIARESALALLEQSPSRFDMVLAKLSQKSSTDRRATETGLRTAVEFGRIDAAIKFGRRLFDPSVALVGRGVGMPAIGFDDAHARDTTILFLPPILGMRRDPKLAELYDAAGLTAYWDGEPVRPGLTR